MKAIFIVLALFILFRPSLAQEQEDPAEFLSSFVQGRYEIIGRYPESDSLYRGNVILRKADNVLQMIRTINGKSITCQARIETAPMAETRVLRTHFSLNGMYYEATYLIHSDLDNYPRLSGYIYGKGKQTQKPGLEAWFILRE